MNYNINNINNSFNLYQVMSDSWDGKSRWAQRPAECWLAFNFGDRYVTVCPLNLDLIVQKIYGKLIN